jgi:hypothetical protein
MPDAVFSLDPPNALGTGDLGPSLAAGCGQRHGGIV